MQQIFAMQMLHTNHNKTPIDPTVPVEESVIIDCYIQFCVLNKRTTEITMDYVTASK